MKIVENFIAKEYQDLLEQNLCGFDFDWHYSPVTVDYENLQKNTFFDKNTIDTYQFCHLFAYHNKTTSSYWQLIAPLLFHLTAKEGVDTREVLRCKANLTINQLQFNESCYYPAHFDTQIDDDSSTITAIYYVNDSDGDTIFFETPQDNNVEELKIINRITPKKGTLVYFDSKTLHAGQLPRNSKQRCVINFNFCQ